jgi:hypothetical protein
MNRLVTLSKNLMLRQNRERDSATHGVAQPDGQEVRLRLCARIVC